MMNALEVIRAAESALSEGQFAAAGNDATEGANANADTIYFDALKACREWLAENEAA